MNVIMNSSSGPRWTFEQMCESAGVIIPDGARVGLKKGEKVVTVYGPDETRKQVAAMLDHLDHFVEFFREGEFSE